MKSPKIQNFISITIDVEPALINDINTIFPKVNGFNLFFHYQQDLLQKFKNYINQKVKLNNLIN